MSRLRREVVGGERRLSAGARARVEDRDKRTVADQSQAMRRWTSWQCRNCPFGHSFLPPFRHIRWRRSAPISTQGPPDTINNKIAQSTIAADHYFFLELTKKPFKPKLKFVETTCGLLSPPGSCFYRMWALTIFSWLFDHKKAQEFLK